MDRWLRVFIHDRGCDVWDNANKPIDPRLPISFDLRTMLGEWTGLYSNRREPKTPAQLKDVSHGGLIVARALKTERHLGRSSITTKPRQRGMRMTTASMPISWNTRSSASCRNGFGGTNLHDSDARGDHMLK
jgi:hypothetical protein